MSVTRGRPTHVTHDRSAHARVRLFVIAAEPGVRAFLAGIGSDAGLIAHSFADGAAALAAEGDVPDIVIGDARPSTGSGLEWVRAFGARAPLCEIILVGGDESAEGADAARGSAVHRLATPVTAERATSLLTRTAAEVRRRARVAAIEADLATESTFQGMVGRSPAMQEVFAFLRRVAPYAPMLLVSGETGTGKELVARAIHDLGPRRHGPFVPVNCGALTDTLLESELFGHTRGAFTGAVENQVGLFEAAHGGTVMLDEIGELTTAAQAALLRVLQDGVVRRIGSRLSRVLDVHVVASSNRDLAQDVEASRFRPDLYYRISGLQVTLPPLRSRGDDILLLAHVFMRDAASRFVRPIRALSLGARDALLAHPWPGNVRELQNVIERACLLAESDVLTEQDLRLPDRPAGCRLSRADPPRLHPGTLRTMERELIERALRLSDGNKAAAACRLGISRRALYRRLHRLGLAIESRHAADPPDEEIGRRTRSA